MAAALFVLCGLVLAGVVSAQPIRAAGNPIQTENANAGSWDWQRAFASPAPAGSIDGYLGTASAAPGTTVTVHGSTSPAATFRVEVFRIGWYGGVGGRFMACAPDCTGSVQGAPQSTPPPEPSTGRVVANWPVSTSFTVGNDWVSGYYVVNFVLTSGPNAGRALWQPLVVTPPPDREKNILVHASVTTWQAYNNWGGKSVYDYNSTGGRAHKVSFDRPYLTAANTGMYDWEVPLTRWLEREGYDVSYVTDIESHRDTALLQQYRLVLINGHDEYWSTPIRDAFENAKAAGTNIAAFGANIGYWHIRFEDGERTMVAYKDAALDPNTNPAAETVQFRDLNPPRSECALTGVQYMGGYSSNRTYTVVDASLSDPWMAGTGFAAGSTIPGVVGYEWDTIVSGCTAGGVRTTFFQYPGSPPEQLPAAHLTRHVLPSGTTLFSTGTMDWALKLDPWRTVDTRVEALTRNVLAAMQQQGTNAPPTVNLTAPAGGSTVSGTISVSANATDDISVAGVQFRLDGVNLGAEDTSSPYSVSWNTATASNGSHTLTAVARDGANLTTTSAPITVTVSNSSNQPPTVTLTAPAGGSTVSGTISVAANATDDVSVTGVQFRLDGANLGAEDTSSPYSVSWNTATASNGSHTLTAVARDGPGLTTTSSPVTVTVSNGSPNQPPTVTLTAPANGSTVSATISVSANASDDASVAGVQFRLDGANLGAEDTSSPYTVSWDTATASNGSHTLTAVARDGPGLTATSTPVTVTVSNGAPPAGATRLGSAQSGDNGSTPSLVFNLPVMQSGDQIVVGVQTSNDTSFTLPSGWTVVSDFRPSTSWHPRVVVLRRAATAGETTVTIPTGHIGKTGVAIAYRGLDPTSPVIATTTASVDSTTLTVPGVTPGVSGARLAYFTGAQGHSTPTGWSPPAGMTEVGDTNTLQWISIAAHEQLLTSGAATGSRSAVFGGSLSLSGVLVALRPASGPPNAPPTVSLTQPANNATVSGTTTVSANASDDTGVAGVQFKVDGANVGSEDTSSPYSISWDTTSVGNGQHTITAVARDSASQTTTSAPITVTVNNVAPNQPPTVSVTQPANNATVSGTATVSANANDDVGVAGVQFKLDGANLGAEDTSAPFTLQWDTTTLPNGPHTLTAVARDGPGLTTTSAAITVTVANGAPNQPPTVTLTAPTNGATVSGTISVAANASDDVSVAGVQFKLDGANLGLEDTSSPFAVSWDTTAVANGAHTLTAVARDGPGLSTTSVVVTVTVSNAAPNQPPTVTLTAPANGATVSGTISVTANASDDVSVAGVQFKLDGANLGAEDTTAPYSISWNTTTVSNGPHTLTAVARDGPGLTTTTAPVTVTVSNAAPNQPPTVSVTAPAGGSTVSATISVTANASDDVSVAGVQFRLDGVNLGTEDTSAPYSVSWNTTTASNGSHTLTAVARDGPGSTTTSAPVTVTVSNAAPPSGLVLAFNFEETGATVNDRSGNGNNGSVSGATSIANGRYGRARSFDGTNDLVQVADSASLDLTTSLTVEAWVYPTSLGNAVRPVAVKQISGSSVAYGLYAHRANPRRPAGAAAVNGSAVSASGTSALNGSSWTHLAFTFDGTSLRLYVNGALVRTTAASGGIAATSGALLVGSDSAGWYRGRIDDLRIYNRALSATEIGVDMATAVP